MKKLFVFLIAFFMLAGLASAEANVLTADGLEKALGINTSTADAESLKVILQAMDDAFIPYHGIRERCLTRLQSLGETKWVNEYYASAEIPVQLSELSYDDLIALKNSINLAIWLSDEWQEVTVPQGVWKVGEDIPAGHWTVKCTSGARSSTIEWGEKLSDTGDSIAWSGRYSLYNHVYNPANYKNSDEYLYEYSFEVRNGDYIIIEDGSAVFMPYAGKPSLGFK